jgi:hypothetical protein
MSSRILLFQMSQMALLPILLLPRFPFQSWASDGREEQPTRFEPGCPFSHSILGRRKKRREMARMKS